MYFDAHMMVSAPETWVESMAASGTDIYTFHVEATEDPKKTIRVIKEAGMKAGIGIKVRGGCRIQRPVNDFEAR